MGTCPRILFLAGREVLWLLQHWFVRTVFFVVAWSVWLRHHHPWDEYIAFAFLTIIGYFDSIPVIMRPTDQRAAVPLCLENEQVWN
jgi:hypothetical protein